MRIRGHKVIFAILWILIWEIGSRFVVADPKIFPSFTAVFLRVCSLLMNDSHFSRNLLASLNRFIIALLFSFPLAIALAYLVIRTKIFGQFFNFFFSSTYSLPKVALYPFILLIIGIGDASKIFLIGLGMFYLFYFNAYAGIEQLESSSYYDIISVFQVNSIQRIWNFYFKGILPSLITGLRTGLGYGLVLVVVSEMSYSTNGIGLFIWNSWDQFRILDMFVGLFVLFIWGSVLFLFCDILQTHLEKTGRLFR